MRWYFNDYEDVGGGKLKRKKIKLYINEWINYNNKKPLIIIHSDVEEGGGGGWNEMSWVELRGGKETKRGKNWIWENKLVSFIQTIKKSLKGIHWEI